MTATRLYATGEVLVAVRLKNLPKYLIESDKVMYRGGNQTDPSFPMRPTEGGGGSKRWRENAFGSGDHPELETWCIFPKDWYIDETISNEWGEVAP